MKNKRRHIKNNGKKRKIKDFWKGVIITIVITSIVGAITNCTSIYYEHYKKTHPDNVYEKMLEWVSIEEMETIITDKSEIVAYKESEHEENCYYNGVALMFLYHNMDEHDRIIKRFTVNAYDIVENISMNDHYLSFDLNESKDGAAFYFYNSGWVETGPIKITLSSVKTNNHPADIFLAPNAPTSWSIDSIGPGESEEVMLLSSSDFYTDSKHYLEQTGGCCLYFTIEVPDCNVRCDNIACYVVPSESGITFFPEGRGGGGATCYAIEIGTSKPTWSETFYNREQRIPAGETMCIPIFIVPEKPCSLSLQIEFETIDGEIISSTSLEDKRIFVPYYDEFSNYIDANLIDWDSLDEEYELVSFPYVDASKVYLSS